MDHARPGATSARTRIETSGGRLYVSPNPASELTRPSQEPSSERSVRFWSGVGYVSCSVID